MGRSRFSAGGDRTSRGAGDAGRKGEVPRAKWGALRAGGRGINLAGVRGSVGPWGWYRPAPPAAAPCARCWPEPAPPVLGAVGIRGAVGPRDAAGEAKNQAGVTRGLGETDHPLALAPTLRCDPTITNRPLPWCWLCLSGSFPPRGSPTPLPPIDRALGTNQRAEGYLAAPTAKQGHGVP